MKNTLNLLIFLLLCLSINNSAFARHDNIYVQITGMHCEACAKSLMKKFKKQKSISNISVEFSTQTFDITLNENADLPDEKIKKVIDWGGYELIEIKRP